MKKNQEPKTVISEAEAMEAINRLNAPPDKASIQVSNENKLIAGDTVLDWIYQATSEDEKKRRKAIYEKAIGINERHPDTLPIDTIIPGSTGSTNQETPASATSTGMIRGSKTPRDLTDKPRLAKS